MKRGIFGWSYPPGVSSLPDDYDEPESFNCPKCGASLGYSVQPSRVESWEAKTDGEIIAAEETLFYLCPHCKEEFKDLIPVYVE